MSEDGLRVPILSGRRRDCAETAGLRSCGACSLLRLIAGPAPVARVRSTVP